MPNISETVEAFLGTVALGSIWSSCSPDFGINGVMIENLTTEQYKNYAMTEEEVSNYLLKYLNHAAYIYSSSNNLKNPTSVEGELWPAGDRPLWSKFYAIKK